MTLGWLLCSAEHLTLKQAPVPSSQYESWAEAFFPELNTSLDVCKAQLRDVLVGVFKPPLIVVSWSWATGWVWLWRQAHVEGGRWEGCDVSKLPLSSPGPLFLLQLRGPQLFLINGPQYGWGWGAILKTAWCPQGPGSA